MATSEENKLTGITTESTSVKGDTNFLNSGLSNQHLLFANSVKNRGGYIEPQETTISKSSCDRCATHRQSSLTDLRVSSTSSNSTHHPSCPNYKSQRFARSSINKEHATDKSKLPISTRKPPKSVLPSSIEQQSAIQFTSPETRKREESQSDIPLKSLRTTLSSPVSLINNPVLLNKKISKIPRLINTHFSSSSKHKVVMNNNTNELFESGRSDDSDQTFSAVSNYKVDNTNDSDNLIVQMERMMDMPCVDSTQLKVDNCEWLISDEEEEEHSKMTIKGQNENIIAPPSLTDTITVRFRPTDTIYEVRVHQHMTVRDVIAEVCRQAEMYIRNDCYLWFDSVELNLNDTIFQAGLYRTSSSITDLPEVRLKYVHILQTSLHLGKQVFLASSEHIAYDQLLDIPLPSTKKYVVPNILKTIAEQIVQRASSSIQPSQAGGTVLIPLPNFSKQSIDSLPTIQLTVPLSPGEFDWNTLLNHLADDLEIDRTNLIIVSVQEGSTRFKIKLRTKFAEFKETVKKIAKKVLIMILPKCEQFVAEHRPSNTSKATKIEVELKKFAERQTTEDTISLSPDEIDLALRLCERPAIINDDSWNFMIEKSRQIRASILQSIQSCSDEYVIDHASIIYNEKIYEAYENLTNVDKNERILFHGTSTFNFDGIFEKNFQYNSGVKRTDSGWYGKGIYFSSSPKKALNYVKSNSNISYLICSLIRLGKTLTVTDMQFKSKPMHPDYDSHYVPIGIDGDPVSQGELPVFEEFVIKNSEQIMPLYIVGMLKVSCFVIWRDAKITNKANSALFEEMRQRYAFNIYGTQTSTEALDILKIKLMNDNMKCVVVTNGADDGEGFAQQCRSIQTSLPIIVYCKSKAYHQQWAARLQGPAINVTTSPEEVFNLIKNTLSK